jgi:hypothetical protein
MFEDAARHRLVQQIVFHQQEVHAGQGRRCWLGADALAMFAMRGQRLVQRVEQVGLVIGLTSTTASGALGLDAGCGDGPASPAAARWHRPGRGWPAPWPAPSMPGRCQSASTTS